MLISQPCLPTHLPSLKFKAKVGVISSPPHTYILLSPLLPALRDDKIQKTLTLHLLSDCCQGYSSSETRFQEFEIAFYLEWKRMQVQMRLIKSIWPLSCMKSCLYNRIQGSYMLHWDSLLHENNTINTQHRSSFSYGISCACIHEWRISQASKSSYTTLFTCI